MSSAIGSIVGGAMGTVGTIFSSIAGIKWDKELSKLKDKDPAYTSSPYAANTLGLAQTLLNGRMQGAAARERGIYGNAANATANINRNATDSSQALAAAAGAQGQADSGFDKLQQDEGNDYYTRLSNLNNANQGMTGEHDKLFDDSVRRWQDQVNIITAQYKARKKGGEDWSNLGASGAGLSGGGSGGGMGMSDKRLKHNYHVIGKSPSGINVYEFSYKGSSDRLVGVMANEVPQASFMTESGYLAVDYNKIDVQFKKL